MTTTVQVNLIIKMNIF